MPAVDHEGRGFIGRDLHRCGNVVNGFIGGRFAMNVRMPAVDHEGHGFIGGKKMGKPPGRCPGVPCVGPSGPPGLFWRRQFSPVFRIE